MMTILETCVNKSACDSFAPNLLLPRVAVLVTPIVAKEMVMTPLLSSSSCPLQTTNLDCLWTATVLLIGALFVLVATAVDRFGRPSGFSLLSLRHSWNELTARRQSNLNCIDFIRVLAILWVMVNHTGSEGRIDVLERSPSAEQFKTNIHNHLFFGPIFGNSALGVEIFLLLSGLLASRSWLSQSQSPATQCLGFVSRSLRFLGHRWLRLFPSFAIFIWLATGCLVEKIMPRYTATMVSSCGMAGVLSHLTFVGNWQSTPTCLGYLWYLSLDMQLYAAAPVFLYLLEKRPKTGFAVAIATVIISCILRAVNCRAFGICNKSDVDIPFISYPGVDPASVASVYEGIWDMYARPYTKCGPFILGLLLGYVTIKCSAKNPPPFFGNDTFVRSLTAGATIAALSAIFGILPEYWNPEQGDTLYNTVYTAVFRTVFSTAIACFIAVFVFGETKEGSFLTSAIWSILAKLTYWAYLVHMIVVYGFNHVAFLQESEGAYGVLAALPLVAIISYAIAFVFFMFIESPLGRMANKFSEELSAMSAYRPVK